MAKRLTKGNVEFIVWLQDVLIPDLKDSGENGLADDFEDLIHLANRVSGRDEVDWYSGMWSKDRKDLEFIEYVLIPDLSSREMAKDFKAMLRMIYRMAPKSEE